jgi:hypothetical protein
VGGAPDVRAGAEKLRRDLEGLPVAYEGEGLLPHPALAGWIARRVEEATGRVARGG